jgi:hypothetical protein
VSAATIPTMGSKVNQNCTLFYDHTRAALVFDERCQMA